MNVINIVSQATPFARTLPHFLARGVACESNANEGERLLTTSNTIVNQAVSPTYDALRISIRSV